MMSKLIQKVKWNLDGLNTEMYMYGEADFEANKAMQEPLGKLYQYENQQEQLRDILESLTEYIESHSDRITNYVSTKDMFEYVDDMWKVFGIDSKKNRECENEVV